ncbi:MAG: CinA family protein [Rhizobiales bacterium]|nr:CinA family protein [Hyphomicrobiales bacterium]
MLDPALFASAEALIREFTEHGLKAATAESCTGGLIAAALTEIAGSSAVFDRGFVTYSNEAKADLLGVPMPLITTHGAVSAEVASAMVEGALSRSLADIAVAVTGIAGPGGASAQKPVGLVYIAALRKGGKPVLSRETFGDIGRSAIRGATVLKALSMMRDQLATP